MTINEVGEGIQQKNEELSDLADRKMTLMNHPDF